MAAARLTAKNADRHGLYETSVQHPPTDIAFMDRIFRRRHDGRRPERLREDFCGTGLMAAAWAKSHLRREAIGLDLHQPTMDYGRRKHLLPLGAASQRVRLMHRNVLDGAGAPAHFDVVAAFNFSYCGLRRRDDLVRYFRRAAAELRAGGGFFLDIHGGTEVFEEMEESTRHRGFRYIWDQEPYDPINGTTRRHIHFRFADGSELKRAFSYDWRLWTIPEMREVLMEAGFAEVEVYWEGLDGHGGGNGVFRRARKADNEAAWIAYVVAWKGR